MIGPDIKAMRERLKLPQKRLTALLQCGEKTLSHWENGHGHPTGLSNTILRPILNPAAPPRAAGFFFPNIGNIASPS